MVLETFAVTGGTPKASRVGNVISVPDPTTVLMVPAASPARPMAIASKSDTQLPWGPMGSQRAVRAVAGRRRPEGRSPALPTELQPEVPPVAPRTRRRARRGQ